VIKRLTAILAFALAISARAASNAGSEPLDNSSYADELKSRQADAGIVTKYLEFRSYPYLDKAQQYLQQGKRAEAKSEMAKALAVNPNDLPTQLTNTAILYQIADYRSAIAQADALLRAAPGFVPALLYRGLSYQAVGAQQKAAEDFISVVRITAGKGEHGRIASSALIDARLRAWLRIPALRTR
jgi:tetratricopeptide (TPR) repeat protein